MTERGEDQTDYDMTHQDAMRRRHADPAAPRPYSGWKQTIVPGVPVDGKHVLVELDREIVDWFRSFGDKYETRINAILRSYYEDHKERH